ncbi:MAG TPA: ParB/RepB/Spo0J family partition protein [Candidatus Saccharimonadales bacterium]|nr:ParB/RepB/Spo0J family partition protein [Candidatus Saccharimonadales bacterium]
MANKGLGKGFDALLPQDFDNSLVADDSERIQKLLIQDIIPNKQQPRRQFDKQALEELAASIKEYGLLQPLVVTYTDQDGKYMLIAGERRWRAAQLAGMDSVAVIVRSDEELRQLEMALVENVQRVDLSPLEQAESFLRLNQQFSQDYADIAQRVGKAHPTVINIVRLLQLPDEAKQALNARTITEGHARAILALKDPAKQKELLNLILANNWNVRQAEHYVSAQKQGVKSTKGAAARTQATTPETEKLSKVLKTPVSIRRMAKGGKLEIGFKNETDLKRIIKRLS